jgi:hypothetical protein
MLLKVKSLHMQDCPCGNLKEIKCRGRMWLARKGLDTSPLQILDNVQFYILLQRLSREKSGSGQGGSETSFLAFALSSSVAQTQP